MPRNVEIAPGYVVEFPDSMSEQQVNAAASRLYGQAKTTQSAPPPDAKNAAALSMFGITPAVIGGVDPRVDFGKGLADSVASVVHGGGQLLRKIPGLNAGPSVDTGTALLQPPSNPVEQAGKVAGDAGMYFLPGGALSKLKVIGSALPKLELLINAGLEGASAAGVSSAQKGTTEGAGKVAALTAGTSMGAQTVLKGAQGAASWLGQRIERALLKPTTATLEGQSEKELVKKIYQYDVGGTLGQSYDKVQTKIQGLYSQLKGVLRTSSAQGAGISVNQVAKDVTDSYLDNPQAKGAVARILDHVEFELNKRGIAAKSGVLDLADGNVVKQAVGDMGAWLHDMRGNVVSDADKVTEDVANRFYTKLKTAIEQNATGPVAAINKQISDLLPIRQAIIRRIPVADRANVLSMADLLGLSTHTLGLSLANRVLNSGRAANALVKAGAVDTAPVTAGITRGVASQVGQ